VIPFSSRRSASILTHDTSKNRQFAQDGTLFEEFFEFSTIF